MHPVKSLVVTAGMLLTAWTPTGQGSDPQLSLTELPAEIAQDCHSAPSCATDAFVSRWIGRARQGDLFVVLSAPCAATGCRAWVVQRQAEGVRALLAAEGEVRLEQGVHAYPVVHTRTLLSDTHVRYHRFEWRDSGYARVETRLAYRVADLECMDADECARAAHSALRAQDVDRAVRIYERVFNLNWI